MRKLVFGAAALAAFLSYAPTAIATDTTPPPPESAATQEGAPGAAAAFVERINALRASLGLTSLTVDTQLEAKATAWARTQADAGRIWHSTLSDGITADWAYLGENVGMGGSVDVLHQAFVRSPHHYDNLVRPDFERVGIGVAETGGTLFVAEVFMKLQPSTPPVAPAPAATPPVTRPAATPSPVTVRTPAPRQPVLPPRHTPTPIANPSPPVPVPAPTAIPDPVPDPTVPLAPPAPAEAPTMPVQLQATPISVTAPSERHGAIAVAVMALGSAAAGLAQRPTFRRSKENRSSSEYM